MAGGRAQLNASDPDRLSNLGRLGLPCNMVACFFVLQSLVIFCFPSSQVGVAITRRCDGYDEMHLPFIEPQPVTASSMNYGKAI
jgi:hypothetical protein